MEEHQKVETIEKAVLIEDEEKEEMTDAIKNDNAEAEEEKMEVETETTEANNNDDAKPLVLKVETESEEIVNLKVEGIEMGNDDDEEYVVMSPEEIRQFLEQKISENIKDPAINPLLPLQKRSQSLLDEIREKSDEISKLGKALDNMYKNQERFLRQVDVLPKIPTNSVSVSVDLPLLLDSVPLMSPSNVQDEEAVIKKDLPEAKVLHPSNSKSKSSTSAIPNNSHLPNIPSGISITPAAPNKSTATPDVPKATPSVSNVPFAVKSTPTAAKPAGNIECIDLTDDIPAPLAVVRPPTNNSLLSTLSLVKHPAPLPPKPFCVPNKSLPNTPPKPRLKISSEERGIVLQWDMPSMYSPASTYSKLKSFDIFGYQEQKNIIINTLLWKKIGGVKAMTLPMACTLTQFLEGQKYHFAIRAVDIHDRCGSYSDPISIVYKATKKV